MNARKKHALLRKGFERGAQWAVVDIGVRMGNLSIGGSPNDDPKHYDAVSAMLRELFVPKEMPE